MEIVTATLTGIALIKKSVDFVKENINTVNDISGIAKQIDGFFEGEAQMNKGQGKGLGIKEQFGIESTASDFIDRKLLEEKRQELKNIINLRFGPTAWDQILSERANRINEAKEQERLKKIERRQQQKEIIDILQTAGIVFCVIAVLGLIITMYFKAFAYDLAYEYKPKDYTRQQKIQRGEIALPTMTTCRLMKQKVFKDKMACIYQGANKTYELEFTDIHIGCPRKYKCVLNPNGKEPSIDKVMESLRSIAK
jgi:preprotein translocase subunit Sss1